MRIVSHVRQAAKSVPESLRQQWAASGVNVEKLQVMSKKYFSINGWINYKPKILSRRHAEYHMLISRGFEYNLFPAF